MLLAIISTETRMTPKPKREKSFKEISRQLEHIISLYNQGYGSKRLYDFCEERYFELLEIYGY